MMGRHISHMFILLAIVACSGKETHECCRLDTPSVTVSAVTGDSFCASWNHVQDAGSYTYVFDHGEEITTNAHEICFAGLEPDTEYEFSVRADAGPNTAALASDFVDVHVITGKGFSLSEPVIAIVATYKSKTIIEWSVPFKADSFEYSLGGNTMRTSENRVEFNDLEASKEYEFSVKALSDVSYISPSPIATMVFTTLPEEADIPAIIFSDPIVDDCSVSFTIYTMSDILCRYCIVPASDYSEASVFTSDLSGSGTIPIVVSDLEPETAYVAAAAGFSEQGERITSTYSFTFTTDAR